MPGLLRAIQLNICHAQRDSLSPIAFGVSKGIITFRFAIAPHPVIARLVPGNPVIKPFGKAELLTPAATPDGIFQLDSRLRRE
ncbi:hypothetical protein [Candidatus Spongiihabitans sp.]|uniref:hypothetical protein n=1 Tax=Candidatus Spongiihabitans sp. TaxID=3101308 RepID=UPI003C7DC59B